MSLSSRRMSRQVQKSPIAVWVSSLPGPRMKVVMNDIFRRVRI